MDEKQDLDQAHADAVLKNVIHAIKLTTPDFRGKALAEAREGEWRLLIWYLERGGRVTPEICLFLLEVLRGEVKRPRRKYRKISETEIVRSVYEARNRGAKNAVEGKGRSARQVYRYLSKNKGKWEDLRNIVADYSHMVKAGENVDPRLNASRYMVQSTTCYFGYPR